MNGSSRSGALAVDVVYCRITGDFLKWGESYRSAEVIVCVFQVPQQGGLKIHYIEG